MKKIALCLMITCLSLTFYSQQAKAQPNDANATASSSVFAPEHTESSAAKVNALQLRLTGINATDKSDMTSLEKKNLRSEERTIRRELKENDGGLYISGGALIVIIVLLIIFH